MYEHQKSYRAGAHRMSGWSGKHFFREQKFNNAFNWIRSVYSYCRQFRVVAFAKKTSFLVVLLSQAHTETARPHPAEVDSLGTGVSYCFEVERPGPVPAKVDFFAKSPATPVPEQDDPDRGHSDPGTHRPKLFTARKKNCKL
jgi:hypothetical protein